MTNSPLQKNSRILALPHLRALPVTLLIALCGIALLSFVSYGYYLNRTVWFVSMHHAQADERSRLSASVAALEAEYAALDSALTLARAHELGLSEAPSPLFLTRETRALSRAEGVEGL